VGGGRCKAVVLRTRVGKKVRLLKGVRWMWRRLRVLGWDE
jgi:hypothetical protein